MKKVALITAALLSAGIASTYAQTIGVVDVKKIFDHSDKVKTIKAKLEKKFSGDKDKLETMGNSIQKDLQDYQKNKEVMNKKDLDALQSKITSEEMQYRDAENKLQQEVFNAQNEALSNFMEDIKTASKNIAQKRHLDLVLPDNNVLYVKNSLDITPDVMKDKDIK